MIWRLREKITGTIVSKQPENLQVCLPSSEMAEFMEMSPETLSSMRLARIMKEFSKGFRFLKNYGKTATVFGSSRFAPDNPYYQDAYSLAFKLAKEQFALITGGGPGIMEAANKGAYDAGGKSGGINIELPSGQRANSFVTDSESFQYFFVRKVMLAFASEVYIFYPGGFGTLDELFEIVTLVQTKKIEPIPIVLVGASYWKPMLEWIEKTLYKEHDAISKEHLNLYHVVENGDEAFEFIIKHVPADRTRS